MGAQIGLAWVSFFLFLFFLLLLVLIPSFISRSKIFRRREDDDMLLDFCDLRVCLDVCDDVRSGGVGRSVGLVSGAPLLFLRAFLLLFHT